MSPGPAPAIIARWAVKYGPAVVPVARRLYEQGRWRQLAILHARTLVDGQFSYEMRNGKRVWVVWTGETVVGTYPEVAGTTDGLFPGARPDRRQDPDDVVIRRVRRRVAELPRPSLPVRPSSPARPRDDE
ncbi:MAG: hypothetical protein ACJA2F_000522 [Nitriliruptoraceae bacterium]